MSPLEPPRFEEAQPLLIAGLKEHYTPDTMDRIPKQWQRFGPYIGNVPGQVDQKSYGVCCNVDAGDFDYLSGVSVSAGSVIPKRTKRTPDSGAELRCLRSSWTHLENQRHD